MGEIITTKQADCKDCYRCLRACPVKAISFTANQAKIEETRCIYCGRCVTECPQKAKLVRNQSYKVRDYLEQEEEVVLSLAPSFPASLSLEEQVKLRAMGFRAIEETAVGAQFTVRGYRGFLAQADGPRLSSCCPVVVNLVEKYYPDLIQYLLPVISPMVAHARLLKEGWGSACKVIFAGPCIAKLKEGEENGLEGVLTFSQLKAMLAEEELSPVQEGAARDPFSLTTRLFPLHHGVLFAVREQWSNGEDYWSVEGIEQCREVLEALRNREISPRFIEMMACQGGCVGGPAIASSETLYKRKARIMAYHRVSENSKGLEWPEASFPLQKEFQPRSIKISSYSEEEIQKALAQMGKNSLEEERNCEGCGYKSCREKAIAVLAGLAVPEMCVPHMRAKAESLASTIVKSTPNAILVLDEQMQVRDYNPAAEKLFPAIPFKKGLKLEDYLDTSHFVTVLQGGQVVSEQKISYPEWGMVTRQTITRLGEEPLVMGIISDITQAEAHHLQVAKMKADVMSKAKEVIHRQMTVAQTIAGLLGETTAETKATLYELLKHLEGEKQ